LKWEELPDGKDSRIRIYLDGSIKEKEKWEEYAK
jgi:hypothetical protein